MQNVPRLPVGRRKRSHEIAELLEKAIASGEFEVGSQLPSEKELAERFGVGRPSVREALFLLQQQGFVEVTSGTRARVTAPDAKVSDRPARRARQARRRDAAGPGTYGAGAAALRGGRRLAGGAESRPMRISRG